MFQVPELARWIDAAPGWDSSVADGNNGAFRLHSVEPGWMLAIIASEGEGWEHVSVHVYRKDGAQQRTPTWKEMAQVKRAFWDDDDVVMQLYPKRADYVNLHPHTLHWWRPIDAAIPTPPSWMVGPVEGSSTDAGPRESIGLGSSAAIQKTTLERSALDVVGTEGGKASTETRKR